MKIHSSSLAYLPNHSKTKNDHVQKSSKEQANDQNTTRTAITLPGSIDPSPNGRTTKPQPLVAPPQLSSDSNNNHTSKAINAYLKQTIQPTNEQKSELAHRVDYYI